MKDCIFCSIVSGDPSNLVWQNDVAAAFNDIHPKSRVHVLVVTKRHILNLDHLDDEALAGKLLLAVRDVAHSLGLKGGWRMQVNNGRSAGQIVDHLHFHVMSD